MAEPSGHDAAGQALPVVTWPHYALRMRARPAGYLAGPALAGVVADVVATLAALPGGAPRGLAAPQLGLGWRVVALDLWAGRAPLVLLDPEVTWRAATTHRAAERCHSLPGVVAEPARPDRVGIRYYDAVGRVQTATLDGPGARVALRKIDLLDGRLIMDV